MEFKKVFSWKPDNKPESTDAAVYASACGVIKRGEYKRWNEKNQGYSLMKEKIYKSNYSRGKQIYEDEARKEKYGKGYQWVTIRNKTYAVHRLVALAWIPNPEQKPQVNHKNGIRDDNRVENLEWVTNMENREHSKQFDRNTRKGSQVNTAKLTEEQAKEIKALLAAGELTQVAIAKKYNVLPTTINWIKKGVTWSHV